MSDHAGKSTSSAAHKRLVDLIETENKVESYEVVRTYHERELIESLMGLETDEELFQVLEPLYSENTLKQPCGPLPSLQVTTILANEVKRRGYQEDCENRLVRWVYFAHSTRLNESLNP